MESVSEVVGKEFRSLVKVFRFYIVLRRFNYIDPLIYALDTNCVRDVIAQALRDYTSYLSSATVKSVNLYYKGQVKTYQIPCLVTAKSSEIPSTFLRAYPDIVHGVDKSDDLCISPVTWTKHGNPVLVNPRKVKDFLKNVEQDIGFARSLISIAVGE
ncbi:hypothetical protein [Sulfuracidifex tepidarius]|uniref:CRISPR type I-A cluster 1/Apern-associated protein Csa5-1 n=1 Tax=Sulfuracidifex tepidarius TaxID=1294262 RepID=A0A510E604_9CREN|nr:hypothetical protein [Sulfuracidifex tepidarius]BBG25075.1 CRISPR type I-A cluster 1/Apern-associated protein Csa5-1 [Sulfuracidifex tepidarius]BBG27857.1 CRISPR type I-A cluster 1/Apern-associated protein Csa5-1 [Sulfuracidifex tepidarius]